MSYNLASEKTWHKSLRGAKIRCTCLRTSKVSISTIAIFTKSSQQSVRCAHSVGRATTGGIVATDIIGIEKDVAKLKSAAGIWKQDL